MSSGVLIFGGSGGIGRALARQLAQRGRPALLVARDAARLEEAVAETATEQHRHQSFVADVTDPAQVAAAFDAAAELPGGLGAVVHAVGSIVLNPAHRTSEEEWQAVRSLNLDSAFSVMREAGQRLGRTGGAVSFVTTAAAQVGLANHEAIAAAKAGVEGMVRAAAASYAARGLRVNAVAPGLVDTPLAAPILRTEASRKASEAMHPLGRIGTADEVAAALALQISDEAGWVTGQVWGVDGGLAQVRGR